MPPGLNLEMSEAGVGIAYRMEQVPAPDSQAPYRQPHGWHRRQLQLEQRDPQRVQRQKSLKRSGANSV